MALFKISKGKSNNLPTNKVDGYCYVTTNDHKFYVDYTKDDGTLDRFALNAVYADTAQKLGTINIGNSSKPIYLEKGTPKECVDFLPLSAGENKKLIGPLGLTENINYGTSLPDEGFIGQLFFVEDENLDGPSLPIGGTAGQVLVKNSSEDGDASWATDIVGNAATATKATQDGNGNIITNTYLPLSGGTINGDLSAVSFTGTLKGNADTATKLATARTISLTGDVTGSGTFDGSSNLSITTAVSDNSHNHNSITSSGTKTMITNTAKWPAGFTVGNIYNSGYPFSYGSTWMYQGSFGAELIFNGLGGDAGVGTGHMYFRTRSDWDTSTWGDWKKLWCTGDAVTGAVWNDYAEYRESDCEDFGYVLMETGDDSLTKTAERLSHFAGVSSDTWGFSQGETAHARTPIAVAGRVLVYPYQDRNNYKPGDCVCAAPGGTVDIMTREEVREWPDRIVGTVSCVPDYEEWGGGESADRDPVKVNGRIWIKVR